MAIHNNSDEKKYIYTSLCNISKRGNLDGFSHQLLRAFDHIFSFLIIINSALSLSQRL